MKRVLFGERVESIVEFSGESLSDVLAEVALHVRDIEAEDGYASIKQFYDSGDEKNFVMVYHHKA